MLSKEVSNNQASFLIITQQLYNKVDTECKQALSMCTLKFRSKQRHPFYLQLKGILYIYDKFHLNTLTKYLMQHLSYTIQFYFSKCALKIIFSMQEQIFESI